MRRKALAELAADYERHIFWNALDNIVRLQTAIEVIDNVLRGTRAEAKGQMIRERGYLRK